MKPWLPGALLFCQVACGQPYQNVPFKPDPTQWTPTCGDLVVDWQDATCKDPAWQLPTCAAAVLRDADDLGNAVVSLATPLTYTESPPLSGAHRADWAHYGEFAFLPPQRWLYNLELGSVAVLYNPCAPASLVDALRNLLREQPDDLTGPFRWVLTPYPGLQTAFAILTWQHSFAANCLDSKAAQAFLDAHYRKAPEDLATDGAYTYAWIGESGVLLTEPATPLAVCTDAAASDAD